MRDIRPRKSKGREPEEGSRPVSSAGGVGGEEFVVVDGAVVGVEGVGAGGAAVVGEVGGGGETGAC